MLSRNCLMTLRHVLQTVTGGYTRMIKIGKRSGDNADMAMLMLVDEE